MNLKDDPLKNDPNRMELRRAYNEKLKTLLDKYIKIDNREIRDECSYKIDELLFSKYGPASFTLKFRQLRNPSKGV